MQNITTSRQTKLSREDILRLIEQNEGPEGLNLSVYDLSNVDLSGLDLHGAIFGTDWRTPHLPTTCLQGVYLEKCNLVAANFIHTDLSGISFFRSNLQNAILGVANCTGTSFKRADLRGVNFHGARLDNTDFTEADLRNSDFHSAYIGNIDLTGANIGNRLMFEDYEIYHAFLRHHNVEEHTIVESLANRFNLARQSYLVLKNAFLNKGHYEEASWAYIKERRMEKLTHWPPQRAKNSYPDELGELAQTGIKRYWQLSRFSIKHLCAYLLDWIVELTCGYGEKPLRTIWWALIIIFAFPLFYWLSNGLVTVAGASMSWLDYFNYSLGAFTTIGFSNFAATNPLAQTLTSIEALLGISVIALLMFALGKRISRS